MNPQREVAVGESREPTFLQHKAFCRSGTPRLIFLDLLGRLLNLLCCLLLCVRLFLLLFCRRRLLCLWTRAVLSLNLTPFSFM